MGHSFAYDFEPDDADCENVGNKRFLSKKWEAFRCEVKMF